MQLKEEPEGGTTSKWKIKPFKEIAPLQRGFDLVNSSLKEGKYPVVYSNGIVNTHNVFMVKGPGVVTGRSGTIGKVTFVKENYWPHNTSLWVTDFKGNYPLYVFYLYSFVGLNQFSTGSGVPTLNRNDVHDFKISFPTSYTEQQAIATVLSEIDTLITNLDKLITKKKAIKQGAMQQLLKSPTQGGKRLQDFDKEWAQVKLGDIGDCIIGLTYSPSNVQDSGTLVLRSSNIQNMRLSLEDNVFVQMDIPQKLITQIGDILICVRNGSRKLIGKCLRIDERVSEQSFGAFMSVYRTKYSKYISQAFQSDIIQRQIEANLGATNNQITNKTLNSFKISIPENEIELNAISSILSDMDRNIESLEQKKSKYIRIKQGMMQELLTGKTRLNHDFKD